MRDIHLNFLCFLNQDFGITVYRRKARPGIFEEEYSYYDFPDEKGLNTKWEITNSPLSGFEPFKLPQYRYTGIISKKIYNEVLNASKNLPGFFVLRNEDFNRRLHYKIETHTKGKKCIWLEPYFLKAKGIWGMMVGYQFLIDEKFIVDGKVKQDRDMLIAAGTLNSKGASNTDFYLFKYDKLQKFINDILAIINERSNFKIDTNLLSVEGSLLKSKEYVFSGGMIANSAYIGLGRFQPLEPVASELYFHFIYKKADRDYAVALLRGLRGESYPNNFSGFDKFFKLPFPNERVKGTAVDVIDEKVIDEEILSIKSSGRNTIPILILESKKSGESDRNYYLFKHKFTNAGVPCQVVTKDLILNETTLKFSLSNIALQIFAKGGGKPWKMKPAGNEYLIIGIGQSYNIEKNEEGNTIEKNITYSVLTDSSGIFKDIQVLSEGVETDQTYYQKLIANIVSIIRSSGYKRVTIHSPIRLSKEKILDKVLSQIDNGLELNVLVINNKTDHFGFDYQNNGLVPFESTFVKLASDEYLVWFEGLQYNTPKITKRYGNPLLIKYWFSNRQNWLKDHQLKEVLLQDCINLSGANWRGFKAKQLPVSIFYCQRIADYIGKFREYRLDHIEINNLKPWFL